MYILKRNNRRYSNKCFISFNAAKAYARRVATKLRGFYRDGYSDVGLTITSK